jgi:hypothetical protein
VAGIPPFWSSIHKISSTDITAEAVNYMIYFFYQNKKDTQEKPKR